MWLEINVLFYVVLYTGDSTFCYTCLISSVCEFSHFFISIFYFFGLFTLFDFNVCTIVLYLLYFEDGLATVQLQALPSAYCIYVAV